MQKLKQFEDDNLPNTFRKRLFLIFFISILSFFSISFLTVKITFSVRDYFYKKKVATLDVDFFLEERKKNEIKKLSSYGYMDEKEEFVHIPIEEAMKKVISQYSK